MALKSIQELEATLGKPCRTCKNLGWEGVYREIRKEHDCAILRCDFTHERSERANFIVSEEQLKELQPEIKNFLERRPKSPKGLSREEMAIYFKTANALLEKVHLYALFANPDLTTQISGVCQYCMEQATIRVIKNRIYIECPDCASMVGDAAL